MNALVQVHALTKSYGSSRSIIDVTLHDATDIVTHEPRLEEIFLSFYEPERSPSVVA